jgi:putative membrane protein
MFERSDKNSERSIIHHSRVRTYVDDLQGGAEMKICRQSNFQLFLGVYTMKISTLAAVVGIAFSATIGGAQAGEPSNLNDLEIAHVAYTADNIDIRYAHLALAISNNAQVHAFAKTMIRDHTLVNQKALALLKKLKAAPQDNFLSRQLTKNSKVLIDEMSKLRGKQFDKRYAGNELAYHKAVNGLVANAFIPNIENAEVKALFKTGLKIFRVHEKHAAMMVKKLN